MVRKCAVWAPDDCDDNCGTAECPLSTDQIAALDASYAPATTNPYVTEDALPGLMGTSIPMRLAAATLVGATSITVDSAYGDVVADGGWVVIDPYTVECEIRKVTNVVLNTLTIPALVYTHATLDLVLWVTSPVWSPILFGAAYDGTTDDTPSHQAAIDDAPANATIDFSGPGTSRLTSGLIIDKSLKLTQPGGGILYQNYSGVLFDIAGVAATDVISIDGIRNTNSISSATFARLASTQAMRKLSITNNLTDRGAVTIAGDISDALHICYNQIGDGGSTRPITVNPPEAGTNRIDQTFIIGNHILGNVASGSTGLITTGNGNGRYLIIALNHLENSAADGLDLDTGCEQIIVLGNVIRGCAEAGIEIKPGSAPRAHNVECISNQIYDCGTGISANSGGLYSQNTIIDCGAIRSFYIFPDTDQVIVAENNTINSLAIGIQATGVTGSYIIRGNNIVSVSSGIRLDSGASPKVEHNRVDSGSTSGAIRLIDGVPSSDAVIRFNDIIVPSGPGVRIDGGWDDTQTYENEYAGVTGPNVLVLAGAPVYQHIIETFTDNDATPDVFGGSLSGIFICLHTLATNITNFDSGLDGQLIEVHFTTANATLVDGANIMLDGSANYNPPAGTIMQFRRRSSVWYEVSRSNT